jgi:hypothetical protein
LIGPLQYKEAGFTRVLMLLVKSKKVLIGHNMIFDIAHIYNMFIGELPSSFAEFGGVWSTEFPKTFDTKTLCYEVGENGKQRLNQIFDKCIGGKYSGNLLFKYDFETKLRE